MFFSVDLYTMNFIIFSFLIIQKSQLIDTLSAIKKQFDVKLVKLNFQIQTLTCFHNLLVNEELISLLSLCRFYQWESKFSFSKRMSLPKCATK